MFELDKVANFCINSAELGRNPYISTASKANVIRLATEIVASSNDINDTIHLMKSFLKLVINDIQPDSLSLPMLDYISDTGMWMWVNNFNKDKIVVDDFEAQYWVIISLKELLDNNNILVKHNEC